MEIAVGAFRLAKRNLDVDTESHREKPIVPYEPGRCSQQRPAVGLRGRLPGVRHKLDVKLAGARAVEFSEENHLPAAESEGALLHKYGFGRADERRLDVRV